MARRTGPLDPVSGWYLAHVRGSQTNDRYALTEMVAQQCELEPGEFVWTGGDCHLYSNHLEQAAEQLSRKPYPLPKLEIRRRPESIFDYRFEDFAVHGYQAHPSIKAPVAV